MDIFWKSTKMNNNIRPSVSNNQHKTNLNLMRVKEFQSLWAPSKDKENKS